MNFTLRSIGLFGLFLFGALFSLTFLSPEAVEKSAKGFVKHQIEKEVREKQLSLSQSQSALAKKAQGIADKLGIESTQLQQDLDNKLPDKIAATLAAMCGYDCERKKAISQAITSSYLDRIKNIEIAKNTLGEIIKGKYLEIVGNLKLDLRIFLGTNLAMFFILLSVSFTKPQAITHLFLPGVLLLLATLASSAIYIFGQDWFYTILYNDYMGFGYLAYLAVIFGFLMDIVFNHGRVTTGIINAILNAIGSAASAIPC